MRIGMIGAGFIAQVAHLPSFSAAPGSAVVGLADNRDALRGSVAGRFLIARHCRDYAELLDDPGIDAVVVSMPRRAAPPVVEKALVAGKSVLSEKPMAFTAADGRRLVAAARKAGKAYAVGYMRRHDAGLHLFRELFQGYRTSGELGEVLHVAVSDFCASYAMPAPPHQRALEPRPFRYPEWPILPEGVPNAYARDYEYTHNVACHNINLARWLFGSTLVPVSFVVRPGGAQTAVLGADAFEIVLQVGPGDSGAWQQQIDIHFRKGRLSASLPSPLARQEIADVTLSRPGRREHLSLPPAQRIWAFQAQAAHFVEGVRSATPLEASGEDSLADLELIEGLWNMTVWRA